jgi:hypothetical protein
MLETRLQRLEESLLYGQHDHEATVAALADLSKRFDSILARLQRLEAGLQSTHEAAADERTDGGQDAAASGASGADASTP